MRRGFDTWLYALLLRWSRGLGPYRLDAVETYGDLRRDAARAGGVRGVCAHFFRAAGHAVWAMAKDTLAKDSLAKDTRRHDRKPSPRRSSTTQHMPTRRSSEMWTAFHQNLRLALRGFRQRPTFSFAVVAMLGLAIGATTTVFSVVDGVLLRDLPYPESQHLVYFDDGSHPGPLYEHWSDNLRAFDTVAAAWNEQAKNLTGEGPPVRLSAVGVSANFLPLFGAATAQGRLLGGDLASDRTVLLDSGLWRRRWGGDPAVIGRSILLDGEPYTVIGVVSPDFVPPEVVVGQRVDLWLPLDSNHEWLEKWNMHVLSVVGRLRPEVGLTLAQTEVDEMSRHLAEEHTQRRRRDGEPKMTALVPLHQATVREVDKALKILLGAVALMLLVGCANVANLLLARGTDRQREMALRSALGAGRARLAGQLLVESLALSVVGGGLGVMVALVGVRAFALVSPDSLPRASEIAIDGRVLAFTLMVSVATGILFGLAPALQSARTDVNRDLKETLGAGGGPQRLRGVLVVAEVALALVLLIGAGLLGHSLLKIVRTEPGFAAEGLVRMRLELGRDFGDETRLPFTQDLLAGVEALPGVTSVSAGWTVPFDHTGGNRCCWRTTFRSEPGTEIDPVRSVVHPITPGYFYTLGISSLRGREFTWADDGNSPVPVVINQAMADKLFAGVEPLGQRMFLGDKEQMEMRVVGLVDGIRRWGLARANDEAAVYVPYKAYGNEIGELSVLMRTATPLTPALAEMMQERVWQVDPAMPVAEIATLPRMISRSLSEPRFFSLLFGVFAGLALLLAASGITSSLLYAVGQRRHEMGVRMAVGARDVDLLVLILRQGMLLTALGLFLGLIGAGMLAQFLSSFIHDLSPTDPVTFTAVSAVLACVALASCFGPAFKASRTDPAETLRAD